MEQNRAWYDNEDEATKEGYSFNAGSQNAQARERMPPLYSINEKRPRDLGAVFQLISSRTTS